MLPKRTMKRTTKKTTSTDVPQNNTKLCDGCEGSIPQDEVLTCSSCQLSLHRYCAGIPRTHYADISLQFVCLACVQKASDTTTVPSRKSAHYGMSAHPPVLAQFPAKV